MISSQDIAQIGLFGVGILTFFCATALPKKVIAENSVVTSNWTDLETRARLDSGKSHNLQKSKLVGNITAALKTQSIEKSNFTTKKIDQLLLKC